MNAHLALQARLHDLEESEKEAEAVKSTDANEENGELDAVEASAEAEVESEHIGEETGTMQVRSDSGEVSECMSRDVKDTGVEKEEDGEGKGRGDGGHTPGEVWTESPHFLWGP
jgi:hypothetical protein